MKPWRHIHSLLKTRSTPHDGYEESFRSSGSYDPVFVPVLEHRVKAENLGALKTLLLSGAFDEGPNRKYAGLIFTSQRAVEAFATVAAEIDGLSVFSSRSVYFLKNPR
jgi:uroporphyrinogen-III synthase